MTSDTISLRRRHLIIAGFAGAAAPLTVLAGQRNSMPSAAWGSSRAASAGAENLVVSGRILGNPDGKPLAGAMIEIWSDPGRPLCTRASSDADGRFFATIALTERAGPPRYIHYRVSHNGRATPVTRLAFADTPVFAGDLVAHLQRDEAAVWRASFGVTLA